MIDSKDFHYKQIIFVFTSEGDRISFKNDNVVVTDKENKIKHQSTCYQLFLLCIVGNMSITTGLIQRAKRFGFSICMMTVTMKVYSVINGGMEGNTLLHRKQYEYEGLDIAQQIIKNKIINQKEALCTIRNKTESCRDSIKILQGYINELENNTYGLTSMLGVEGSAARIYFKNIFDVEEWKGRKPRVKADYLNSTLDIGYTILFNIIEALLSVYGFDIYQGVLHRAFYMRKSLVCDLVEPFRPLIDLQVRKSINLGQCREDDFHVINGKHTLEWKKSPVYTSFLLEPLIRHKEDMFLYIRDYYRAFMKGKKAEDFPVFMIK